MKNEEYVCPACGDVEGIEVIDTEFDNNCISRKMFCSQCGRVWREYFIIKYDGYTCEDKEYDADGKEMGW